MPRDITKRLAESGYTFEEADAWLDLWCHTLWQDPLNIFSFSAPAVQIGPFGAALTLETLGRRWGWEKTKVWRFLQKHRDAFALHKLPGSCGCLIFNIQYPTGEEFVVPESTEIIRILDEIRILGANTHLEGSDNSRLNKLIAWKSQKVLLRRQREQAAPNENRVAVLEHITRAYISHSSCKTCDYDCNGMVDRGRLSNFGFQAHRADAPPGQLNSERC